MDFMEGGGVEKLAKSFEKFSYLASSIAEIEKIAEAYKNGDAAYKLDLSKLSKLKVYIGKAVDKSVLKLTNPEMLLDIDTSVKPELELSPLTMVDESNPAPKEELELSEPVVFEKRQATPKAQSAPTTPKKKPIPLKKSPVTKPMTPQKKQPTDRDNGEWNLPYRENAGATHGYTSDVNQRIAAGQKLGNEMRGKIKEYGDQVRADERNGMHPKFYRYK